MSDSISLGKCKIQWITPKAVKVVTPDYGELWVPQRAIHSDSEIWNQINSEGNFIVCKWWAHNEGLI